MTAPVLTPRYRWQLALRDSRTLSKSAKLVGYTLAMHMDGDGGSCFPGVRLLATETRQATDTVTNAIDELVEERFLRIVAEAIGSRPREVAARLDCVPPIRTQTGDVASESTAVASESVPRSVRNDGTEGSRGNRRGPTTAPSREDVAAERKRRNAIREAKNVGHEMPEYDLRVFLTEAGVDFGDVEQAVVEARNRRSSGPGPGATTPGLSRHPFSSATLT